MVFAISERLQRAVSDQNAVTIWPITAEDTRIGGMVNQVGTRV